MPDQLKTLRAKVTADRKAAYRAALDLAERADHDQRAAGELEFALDRVEALDRRLTVLPEVEVVREPDLYEPGGHSFFRDVLATQSPIPIPGTDGPAAARERLAAHQAHEERGRERRNSEALMWSAGYGLQCRGATGQPVHSRALSTIAGAGGQFSPPRYLLDLFASVSRSAAPLSRLVRTLPLPDGTVEIHVPRFTAVSGVVGPQTENTLPQQTVTASDAIVHPVTPFVGEIVASQQLLDRGPNFDNLVTKDFSESLAASLESQMIAGSGIAGQLLGLLSIPATPVDGVPGAIVNTFTSATPTTAAIVQSIAQLAADISDARDRPPGFALMRPARWFALAGSPDGSTNEPTMRPGAGYTPTTLDDAGPVGPLAGLPCYISGAVPANLGAGGNQDTVLAARGSDILLLEGDPIFQVIAEGESAQQLGVYLVCHKYFCFIPDRYPSAVGSVTGTGFITPAGF
jgi:HK97 family phage major capsid protein